MDLTGLMLRAQQGDDTKTFDEHLRQIEAIYGSITFPE